MKKFEVGDIVKITHRVNDVAGWGLCWCHDMDGFIGGTYTIKKINGSFGVIFEEDEDGYHFPIEALSLVNKRKKPRKHADLIKQWADDDSLEIEVSQDEVHWLTSLTPCWSDDCFYRIKPKKVTRWRWVLKVKDSYYITSSKFSEEEIKSFDDTFSTLVQKVEGTEEVYDE